MRFFKVIILAPVAFSAVTFSQYKDLAENLLILRAEEISARKEAAEEKLNEVMSKMSEKKLWETIAKACYVYAAFSEYACKPLAEWAFPKLEEKIKFSDDERAKTFLLYPGLWATLSLDLYSRNFDCPLEMKEVVGGMKKRVLSFGEEIFGVNAREIYTNLLEIANKAENLPKEGRKYFFIRANLGYVQCMYLFFLWLYSNLHIYDVMTEDFMRHCSKDISAKYTIITGLEYVVFAQEQKRRLNGRNPADALMEELFEMIENGRSKEEKDNAVLAMEYLKKLRSLSFQLISK